ncbi:MAG: LLM class flavin-dependent oxidoreductase, partial [Acidimicrobiaceae bacterium]|nr:LLM class flavin-dependent oxidoreductase [Acidimicrobiaceae bacterium]
MNGFRGLGLSLSNEDPVADTLAVVAAADRLGFEEVSLPESRLFNSVTAVAAAALHSTRRVTVRIGVANPVFRSPVLLALEAATLADIGPGRLRYGLGAAEWTVRRFGMDPPGWRPLTNTVEAVRAVRCLTAGEELDFVPTTFSAAPGLRLDRPPPVPVPVDVGAVSRRMMEVSGEFADGVQLGAITSVGYTRWARERLAAGAARAGRDVDDLLLSANVLTSVGPDRRAARDAVKEVLAYYLARVEGVVVDEAGADPEAVAAVRAAVAEGGEQAGAAVLSDSLVDVFGVAGTPDDVIEGLGAFEEAGLDLPLAWYTFGPDRDAGIRLLAEQVRPAV